MDNTYLNPGPDAITSFSGEHAFLSNFYLHPIEIDGDVYPTNEHAFQALKTDVAAERQRVREAPTPASAKAKGKRVTLRPGWDTERLVVMERVVRAKFADPELARLLVATGNRELIEGNKWRDTVWGCVRTKEGGWKGRNELGKILMRVREELQGQPIADLSEPAPAISTPSSFAYTEALIADLIAVAALANCPVTRDDIFFECLPAPHIPATKLPNGKMAVYVLFHGTTCLKVGKVGPKSAARFTSQHYLPSSAKSTLAGAILRHRDRMIAGDNIWGDADVDFSAVQDAQIGQWLRENTTRCHFYLAGERPTALLNLLEAFLQCRLGPMFEG